MNSVTYLEEQSSGRSLKENLIGRFENLAFVFLAVFLEMKSGEESWIENFSILEEDLELVVFKSWNIGKIYFLMFLIYGRRRSNFGSIYMYKDVIIYVIRWS